VHVAGIVQPQQQRSRESFARVRTATLAILAEKGVAGLTIAEVSERAGVSVGSIYGRVGNRANLLRVVQQEELDRIVASVSERFQLLESRGENSVAGIVRAFVEEYEINAQSISALVTAATEIDELAVAGPRSWAFVRDLVISALRRATDAGGQPVSQEWMEWIFTVADGTTIQHLNHPYSAERTDAMIANLAATVRLLLNIDQN
jgi:AcrR family transcriptional regulator